MSITLDGSNLATVGVINSATAQASTSGTSIDFTGIPSGIKRITVMFKQLSTNGTSIIQVQIGDSGGVKTTSYVSTIQTGSTRYTSTTGFNLVGVGSTTWSLMGTVVLTLQDASNTWVANIMTADDLGGAVYSGAGYKATSTTLDRVRITTVNGTDTFDAGSINILYE